MDGNREDQRRGLEQRGQASGRECAARTKPGRAMAAGRWVATCVALLMLRACAGSTHLSFLDPQGPVADAQRWHFYWVLGIMAVLVAGPIFLLLPFFAWGFRYGNKAPRYPPRREYPGLGGTMGEGGAAGPCGPGAGACLFRWLRVRVARL